MNPKIDNYTVDNNTLKFTLSGVDVSFANAIRRIILSEIPIVGFKTLPYEQNKCNITANTSRLNNEILKQRLSCIPIHISDLSIPLNNYILEIDEENKTAKVKVPDDQLSLAIGKGGQNVRLAAKLTGWKSEANEIDQLIKTLKKY